MLISAARRIERELAAGARVLDIGAWAQPFLRATHVVDLMPYDTRGVFGTIGGGPQRFSADTWHHHDVCGAAPLPFPDKFFDFVVCSHTLEDMRDPLRACREISRVGNAGYVECPARFVESIRGLEHSSYPGYYHHHWLVEAIDAELVFRFKTPLLNRSRTYTAPRRALRRLAPEERVLTLWWTDTLNAKEVLLLSEDAVAGELRDFMRGRGVWRTEYPRPRALLKAWLKRSSRLRPFAERLLKRSLHKEDEGRFWRTLPSIDLR